MRVYLDAWSLQRPLDDRAQPRINVEAEAVLTILSLVEAGDLDLLSSEVLQFESAAIPDVQRQARAGDMLALAGEVSELADELETQAAALIKAGLKPMDALHVAAASGTKADFFCTCDDLLLTKSKKLKSLGTRVVSPLELIAEVTS